MLKVFIRDNGTAVWLNPSHIESIIATSQPDVFLIHMVSGNAWGIKMPWIPLQTKLQLESLTTKQEAQK